MTTREELDRTIDDLVSAARRSGKSLATTQQWREACSQIAAARAHIHALFTTKERNGNEKHPQG